MLANNKFKDIKSVKKQTERTQNVHSPLQMFAKTPV